MNVSKGSTAPKAEEKTYYEVGNGLFSGSQSLFLTEEKEATYIWTLFKSQGGNWIQVKGNIKHGKKVPYTFGEKVVGIPYKIVVNSEGKNLFNQSENKFFANIMVTPRTAKEPSIGRVILPNRGKANVNKANFNESLSAQSRTANLVGREITFYLWEEGAKEEDKYKKPKKARVDKNGIAEVKFSLMEYASQPLLMQIFNFNSKTTKKFFVTAVYDNKKSTNKGAVEASDANSTTEKKEETDGILSKTSEVLGEGWKSIVEAVEKALAPTSVGTTPQKKKKKDDKVCECEARVRAYMRMLRVGEGTGEVVKSSKYNKQTKRSEIIYITHDFEGGYTKLFGGGNFTKSPHNKDMSDHPQIKILYYTKKNGEKVYSSAAGAYEVMGYTWSDKGMINNRKTYNIKDFTSESQDKFCVVLFKHKRAGMLEMIIKGDIKGATETYGSYEWASLPPGRYGQPIETMEKALELYNKFYQEELSGKSPLHLKKGFLNEFGYNCRDEAPSKTVAKGCGKSEIDLRNKIRDRQMVACKKTCDDILINNGLKATSLARLYQTALENNSHTKLNVNTQISQEAVSYLDSELEKDHPVQVGVDHGLGYKINNNADHTTDHFVVIVGRKCDGDKCYYIFYDVGTSHKEKGASDANRLYLDKTDFSLKGKTVYNGNFYTVTQVRKN